MTYIMNAIVDEHYLPYTSMCMPDIYVKHLMPRRNYLESRLAPGPM